MRQAGEVTYAGMCQSIYQQIEFMSEPALSMLTISFLPFRCAQAEPQRRVSFNLLLRVSCALLCCAMQLHALDEWMDGNILEVNVAHGTSSVFRVVEFASASDMKTAIEKLDDTELNGRRIRLVEDKRRNGGSGGGRRGRSRSSSSRSRSRSRRRSR